MISGSFNKNSGPGEVYLDGNNSRLPEEYDNQIPIPYSMNDQ
jgi:hypothetical protein